MTNAPPYPAPVIRAELDKLHKSQDEIAGLMNLGRLTVNQLVNGHRAITTETAIKLEDVTKISAEHWLKLQRDWDLWMARGKA